MPKPRIAAFPRQLLPRTKGVQGVPTSVRSLAHSLVDALQDRTHRLTPRPYNQHKPGDSLWWLVPSTEWPAYRHGKLYLALEEDNHLEI